MSLSNCILVVSDNQSDIQHIKDVLLNLRQKDSIVGCELDEANSMCQKYIPKSVIIFANKRLTDSFQICKSIKASPSLENTSIVFVFDDKNESDILTAFDIGISDYLIKPLDNIEIMVRALWALKSYSYQSNLENKLNLLKMLGIIDEKTEALQSQFFEKVLSNEFTNSKKHKYSLTLMSICTDPKDLNKIDSNMFAGIIKNSIRTNDILGHEKGNLFHLILPRTGSEGAITIYQRIKNNLDEINVYAGVSESVEINDYKQLWKFSTDALNDALLNKNNPDIMIKNKEVSPKAVTQTKGTPAEDNSWISKVQSGKDSYSEFKKQFIVKVDTVLRPVLNKVEDSLKKQNYEGFSFDKNVTETLSFIKVKDSFEDTECTLKIIDPGFAKVIVDEVYIKNKKQSNKRIILQIEELTEEKLTEVVKKFLNSFKTMINS